jgi:hypothetical protein
MWIKVWSVPLFHTANIYQSHCESWKVCLSVVAKFLLLALTVQSRIRAVGCPFLLIWRFIIIIIRQTELINLGTQCRDGAGERFGCSSLPSVLSIAIAISSMALSNMASLEAIEPYRILLIRCESMIFILLKESVIYCSVWNVWNSSGITFSKRVLARLPACKTDLRFPAFVCLMKCWPSPVSCKHQVQLYWFPWVSGGLWRIHQYQHINTLSVHWGLNAVQYGFWRRFPRWNASFLRFKGAQWAWSLLHWPYSPHCWAQVSGQTGAYKRPFHSWSSKQAWCKKTRVFATNIGHD